MYLVMRSWFWLLIEVLPVRARLAVVRQLLRRQPGWPDALNYKLASLFARFPDSRLPIIADKLRARDYIKTIAGEACLPKLLGVYKRAESISFDRLPRRFVVKANHGSGWNYLVRDSSTLDRDDLVRQANKWMSMRYGGVTEWWYNRMPRRIVVEEFLDGKDGDVPWDFKLFTFKGEVRLAQVDRGRFGAHVRNYYDREWRPLVSTGKFPMGPEIPRPLFFDQMCSLAKRLVADIPFVRVDFYEVCGRIVVGELTLLPAGARDVVTTAGIDRWLAQWFDHAMIGAAPPDPYPPETNLGLNAINPHTALPE